MPGSTVVITQVSFTNFPIPNARSLAISRNACSCGLKIRCPNKKIHAPNSNNSCNDLSTYEIVNAF